MIEEIAIRARGLSKIYRVYQHPVDMLMEAISRRERHIDRVALDNVNIELRRGEIVGVIGRNGAGKSTLLKLIAGTIERSAGDLTVNGRITAILELGTGFHPDYTGRENIYMGGLCLGMSRREINIKINGIIEFSELGEYIDQPFKTYSTGMQARLTFSTAISVDPDILIVDEALSVGDARFQIKCYSRMQKLRDKRTTILLVSHDTNAITSFCDRAIILEKGQLFAQGNAKSMSVLYHNLLFGNDKIHKPSFETPTFQESNIARGASASFQVDKSEVPQDIKTISDDASNEGFASFNTKLRYGSAEGQLLDWGLLDPSETQSKVVQSGTAFQLYMTFHAKVALDDLSFGFAIKDRRGTVLWGVTNITQKLPPYRAQSGETLTIVANSVMWLADGDYFVTLGAAHLNDGVKIDFVEDAIEFKVIGSDGIFTTSIVNLQTEFKVTSNLETVRKGGIPN